jgi:hypothetical protein
MDITYLRIARRLWNVDYLSHQTNRANMRKWVRALRVVGNAWLLNKNAVYFKGVKHD